MDQKVLKWFGHVERMDEYRMARRVFMTVVRLDGWREDGLEQQTDDGGGCTTMQDRKELRALVHM